MTLMNKNIQSCQDKNTTGGISNSKYYNTICKLTNNQLRAKEVNKFMIDFNLPDKTLINITKELIHRSHNPELFVFVLETTLQEFEKFINIPSIDVFYKDIIGGSCVYNNNKLDRYVPRLRFKFYNGGKLVYCTVKNDYDDDKTYGSHNSLVFNDAFINIVKIANDILIKTYETDNKILINILDNIISLFDIKGDYKYIIAKLLIVLLSQEGNAIITYIVLKLFKKRYYLSNYLSNTIYKRGTKYIIKQPTILKGFIPVNYTQPEYNDKFNLTYIIDENNPRVLIKMDISDIDGLIKSYDPNEKTQNNQSSTVYTDIESSVPSLNSTATGVPPDISVSGTNYKKINFLSY